MGRGPDQALRLILAPFPFAVLALLLPLHWRLDSPSKTDLNKLALAAQPLTKPFFRARPDSSIDCVRGSAPPLFWSNSSFSCLSPQPLFESATNGSHALYLPPRLHSVSCAPSCGDGGGSYHRRPVAGLRQPAVRLSGCRLSPDRIPAALRRLWLRRWFLFTFRKAHEVGRQRPHLRSARHLVSLGVFCQIAGLDATTTNIELHSVFDLAATPVLDPRRRRPPLPQLPHRTTPPSRP